MILGGNLHRLLLLWLLAACSPPPALHFRRADGSAVAVVFSPDRQSARVQHRGRERPMTAVKGGYADAEGWQLRPGPTGWQLREP